MKRKLTTIFCADVQNYSALMAHDEATTLARLQRYRQIMEELFASHDGRKVNTWGDAMIGEFTLVVEAVRCAVEIQDAIIAENRDLPKTRQMWLRIGINLGDVMEDNGDIYGDGVNVAARLESIAEPGGIMVSESIYKFTHKQLAFGYDYAGEQQVKKGDDPIVSYRVRTGGSNSSQAEIHVAGSEEDPEPFAAASAIGQSSRPESSPKRFLNRLAEKVDSFMHWLPNQPTGVKFSVFIIGFFAAINILFSGIATPWFIFPAAPFALYILLKTRGQRKNKG